MDSLGKILHVKLLGYTHWFMSISLSQIKDCSILVDQAVYATSIVVKYLYSDKMKTSINFYKTTLPSDRISIKSDASTRDEQVDNLSREINIHYRAWIRLLIYFLYTRVDLSFAVHKLAKFLLNPGKVYFEGLVNLLRYIRYNKTLGLKYYAEMKDAPLSDLLRQANIKNENQLLAFYDSS